MTPEQKQTLQRKASEAMESKNIAELTQGYLRYEALRKLTPRQFKGFNDIHLDGKNFDEMVDELVVQPWTKTKQATT